MLFSSESTLKAGVNSTLSRESETKSAACVRDTVDLSTSDRWSISWAREDSDDDEGVCINDDIDAANFLALLVNVGQTSDLSTTGGPDEVVVRSRINFRARPQSDLLIASVNKNSCSGDCFCFFCQIMMISNLSKTLI